MQEQVSTNKPARPFTCPLIPGRRHNIHIIFASYTTDFDQTEIKEVFRRVLVTNEIKQATITFIEMVRAYCICKEKCEKFYKQTEVIAEKIYITNPEPSGFIFGGLVESIGNDLETFPDEQMSTIEQNINTFFISMLTHDEKEKLTTQNENFTKTFWKHQSQGLNPGKKCQNSLIYKVYTLVYTVKSIR